MRKQLNITTKCTRELSDNKRQYALAAGLFLLGILIGSIAAITSKRADSAEMKAYFDRFLSAYPLQGAARSEIFQISMLNYLRLAALMWIAGWLVWLLPLGALQVGIKGFRTGFTVAYLLRCYQLRGILLAVISILPQNLILIPALCFFMVYQIKFAADRRHLRGVGAGSALKRQVYGHNLAMTGVFLALLLICALIEGYIVPTMLQPVCGLFI